jgi:hypothetical protein
MPEWLADGWSLSLQARSTCEIRVSGALARYAPRFRGGRDARHKPQIFIANLAETEGFEPSIPG